MFSCKVKLISCFYFTVLMLFSLPAQALMPKAVDGDSIILGKREIRLSGIDAPEYDQFCFDETKQKYACGQDAKEYLKSIINESLTCETVTIDKYKREVAVCYCNNININKKMVEMGQAVAYKRYTHDYDEAEKIAKENKRGIWRGKFMKPELYRILKKD